uniref:DEAD-box RNA helicase Q domain-containing protein n=1 Tax=Salix viminalis TaxID=40686 RepID=A0A6N2ML23_SALVM
MVQELVVSVNKKRKRKTKAERVEGFSVFKGSDSVPVVINEATEQEENNQKELNRQNEEEVWHPCLWKQRSIPLQGFAELSTRYGCESYLLHNLVKLGFKEPTPIQRQAIPVLLSKFEMCFCKIF